MKSWKAALAPEINNPNRSWGLDFWRAWAILLVLWVHSVRIWKHVFGPGDWLMPADGVNLFFVLSGFLIGSQLLKRESSFWFGPFFKRRWFRTLPNYYLFFVIHVVYYLLLGIPEMISLKPLLFVQNLYSGYLPFYGESWSLAVEEWFYLLLPILLWPIAKNRANAWWYLGVLWVALLVFKGLIYQNLPLEQLPNTRIAVLARLDTLVLGVWMAAISLNATKLFRLPWLWVSLAVGFYLIWHFLSAELDSRSAELFKPSAEALYMVALLPLVAHWNNPFGKVGKVFTWLSLMAYGLYLLNLLVFDVLLRLLVSFSITGTLGLAFYGLALVAMGLLAHLLYSWYERPLMDLRNER